MGRLITVEELPQYAGGDLKLDSVATGMPEFRMRVFRYAPSDISVPPSENFLIVNYREGATSMNRRVTGPWKQDHVGRGVTTLLTRAEPSNWVWRHDIEVSHFYISPALMMKTASEAFDRDAERVELHDLVRAEDPVLAWISDQMIQEVAAGGPGGRLCYDALALQASVHILRKYASVQFKLPRSQGRFRPAHARADRGLHRTQHLPEHHARGTGQHMQLHAGSVCTQIPIALRDPAACLCLETQGGTCVPAPAQGSSGAQGNRASERLFRSEPSQSGLSPVYERHAGRISQR
jgi:hypothetical protein